MAWLDAFLGRIFHNGVEIELSSGLNFKGALTADLNPATRVIDVDVAEGSVTADQAAPVAANRGVAVALPVTLTAATPGTADDVEVFALAPWDLEILDVTAKVSTAIGGSSVQLRSATGGGGTTYSSVLSTAATGTVRDASATTFAVAEGSPIYVRRSDRGVAGKVIVWAVRT